MEVQHLISNYFTIMVQTQHFISMYLMYQYFPIFDRCDLCLCSTACFCYLITRSSHCLCCPVCWTMQVSSRRSFCRGARGRTGVPALSTTSPPTVTPHSSTATTTPMASHPQQKSSTIETHRDFLHVCLNFNFLVLCIIWC